MTNPPIRQAVATVRNEAVLVEGSVGSEYIMELPVDFVNIQASLALITGRVFGYAYKILSSEFEVTETLVAGPITEQQVLDGYLGQVASMQFRFINDASEIEGGRVELVIYLPDSRDDSPVGTIIPGTAITPIGEGEPGTNEVPMAGPITINAVIYEKFASGKGILRFRILVLE